MSKWTKTWPTEEGRYWFYGWPYGEQRHWTGKVIKPELNHVAVHQSPNSLMVVREGQFWYERDGGIGMFLKIKNPGLPDVSGMIVAKEKKQ